LYQFKQIWNNIRDRKAAAIILSSAINQYLTKEDKKNVITIMYINSFFPFPL